MSALRDATAAPSVVLVVDDEEEIRLLLRAALERDGRVRVVLAGSAEEALRALNHEAVDVILSDHRMPGTTGLDLLARARATHPQAVRILMTAYPEQDMAGRAVNEARLERFFPKPLSLREVVAALHEILDERAAEGQRARAFARSFDAMHRAVARGAPAPTRQVEAGVPRVALGRLRE